MHSRIFQTSKEPISEDKYFDEGKYYGGFVEQVADYVMESNRDDDLDWLRRAYEGRGIEIDVAAGTITIVSRLEYFKPMFEKFQNKLNQMKGLSLDAFMNTGFDVDFAIYELTTYFSDKYSFYVDQSDYPVPFDEFVRDAKDRDVYYVGATFDYHY